jgi:AcrR family transcriptional regulator
VGGGPEGGDAPTREFGKSSVETETSSSIGETVFRAVLEDLDRPKRVASFPAAPAGYPARVARLPQALRAQPVGRTRVTREQLGERQYEAILAAATKVFAKRGYQDSTIENIVDASGVGVGSFYAHFEGKDDCLDQVCARIEEEASAALEGSIESTDWAGRLCDGLHAALAYIKANPLAARVALLEAQTGGPDAVGRYSAMVDRLAAFLRRGRRASTLGRSWPATFEEATASGLVWLMQERLVRGELDDPDALFTEMAGVALEPYLGAAGARREIRSALSRLG